MISPTHVLIMIHRIISTKNKIKAVPKIPKVCRDLVWKVFDPLSSSLDRWSSSRHVYVRASEVAA